MDRATLAKLWQDSWADGIWFAPWSKATGDLTATQAAWKPAPGRHSIWQNVNHVVFWRWYTMELVNGRAKPPASEVERLNFAEPPAPTEAEWAAARARLLESHTQIAGAIADERNPLDRLQYHLAHDAYHLGQIMYVRSMQGLKAIE